MEIWKVIKRNSTGTPCSYGGGGVFPVAPGVVAVVVLVVAPRILLTVWVVVWCGMVDGES